MAEVRTLVFNVFVSSTEVFISSAKRVPKVFVSNAKCAPKAFASSTINVFIFYNMYLEGGVEILQNSTETGEKVSVNFISFRDGPEKSTKTRQRRKNARRLPNICCVFFVDVGSLLAFFHLYSVSVLFSSASLNEISTETKRSTLYLGTLYIHSLAQSCLLFTCEKLIKL